MKIPKKFSVTYKAMFKNKIKKRESMIDFFFEFF